MYSYKVQVYVSNKHRAQTIYVNGGFSVHHHSSFLVKNYLKSIAFASCSSVIFPEMSAFIIFGLCGGKYV
jgi:hypothetical protein